MKQEEVKRQGSERKRPGTHHARYEPSWRDAINADAEREKVVREKLCEVAKCRFGEEIRVRAASGCRILSDSVGEHGGQRREDTPRRTFVQPFMLTVLMICG